MCSKQTGCKAPTKYRKHAAQDSSDRGNQYNYYIILFVVISSRFTVSVVRLLSKNNVRLIKLETGNLIMGQFFA